MVRILFKQICKETKVRLKWRYVFGNKCLYIKKCKKKFGTKGLFSSR